MVLCLLSAIAFLRMIFVPQVVSEVVTAKFDPLHSRSFMLTDIIVHEIPARFFMPYPHLGGILVREYIVCGLSPVVVHMILITSSSLLALHSLC